MAKKNSSGGKGNKLILIVLLIVALLACAAAGYAWMQLKSVQHGAQTAEDNGEQQKKKETPAPVFVPLESFTVSLKPDADRDDRVLYIGVTLRVADAAAEKMVNLYLPEVRSRLLMLFSQQTATELNTLEGKEALRQKVKEALVKPFAGQEVIAISDVYYNVFILR